MADPVISGCLARIRKGDVSAVGVLADYLEENTLPEAKRVRKAWNKTQDEINWWSTTEEDLSRRRVARWEAIARWRRWLRKEIQKIFKRKWQPLPLVRYK